jgi:hypothetical protein
MRTHYSKPQHPFIPTVEGTAVAQAIRQDPSRNDVLLDGYHRDLWHHYKRIGMVDHNPDQAYRNIVRNLLRIANAVLHYEVELELAASVATAQKAGQPLVVPEYLEATHFDRALTRKSGAYSGPKRDFLLTSAAVSYAAAGRFIERVLNGKGPYLATLDAYVRYDCDFVASSSFPNLRLAPMARLKDNVVAANVTALDVLVPAADHLRPHFLGTETIAGSMAQRVRVLSDIASTRDGFFRRVIGDQHVGATAPKVCPFTHDPEEIAAGRIWSIASLRDGPWPVPASCPENIPFRPDPKSYAYATGAQLRLASLIPIAQETIWAPA